MFTLLSRVFRRTASTNRAGQAHLTFGSTSIGRTVSRTRLILKKQLWIWPIIAVVLLAAIGYGIRAAIERTMKASLQSQLETMLGIERSMLETWLKVQESNAESLANTRQVRETIAKIIEADSSREVATAATANSTPTSVNAQPAMAALHTRLAQELSPGMSAHGFVRFIAADKQQRIVAATSPELIGQTIPEYEPFLSRALEGQIVVSPPFASVVA